VADFQSGASAVSQKVFYFRCFGLLTVPRLSEFLHYLLLNRTKQKLGLSSRLRVFFGVFRYLI
jgi:hypothetical protein